MLGKSHCESVAPSRRNRRFATPHSFFLYHKIIFVSRAARSQTPYRYDTTIGTMVPDVTLQSQIPYYTLVPNFVQYRPRGTVCIACRTTGDRYCSILLEL